MISAERRRLIHQKLEMEGIVKISDLAEEFGVSAMTIRRDLDQMEQETGIQRTHGGAILTHSPLRESPLMEKVIRNDKAKQAMSKKAFSLLNPGESIILDAGSTNLTFAKELKRLNDLLLVTNDIKIALELGDEESIRVILTGGELKPHVYSLEGFFGESMLQDLHVDTAFLGCDGFGEIGGVQTNSLPKVKMKQAMLERAHRRILMADASKMNQRGLVRFAALEQFHVIVTDDRITDEFREMCRDLNIDLVVAERDEKR
ncbi:DeoR/GlpR transcriptional regulator [Kroppenstedtia pulmonis]|uniref:DeoR/GlpR transcriptional regulator n=1 Tax=Kroppenstedtia pulmonis TaxID=1380685 RepID=A0A7D4BQ60_9BACL|nr:DeoR/GlpR family DNA-binding transcription regulator [Kroppenstedtia pulmonis]QKG84631.1 DeoR/GlpR transcriptional regulator [Kroppenstedtia pulmonis]